MSNLETAEKFFELCETGKGWDACKGFAKEDASFRCDVLPFKTLHHYTDWMKGLIDGITPDGKYKIFSLTSNKH